MSKSNVHPKFAELARQIEEQFATGEFVMPFGVNRSAITQKPYRGMNALMLMWVRMLEGYRSTEWLTLKQANQKNWKVAKGAKGTVVAFYSRVETKDSTPELPKHYWLAKYYTVFNKDQLLDENGDKLVCPDVLIDIDSETQIKTLDQIAKASGVKVNIVEGGSNAFYSRANHAVTLPAILDFDSVKGFITTYAHELGHSSGKVLRADWEKGSFGSIPYAKEEVVAELCSVFLSSMLGLDKIPLSSHSAYIAGWLNLAKSVDPEFFGKAVDEASKAAIWMYSLTLPTEDFGENAADTEAVV